MTIPDDLARLVPGRDLCGRATSSGGMPHASPMSCALEPDPEYIHMATLANTLKRVNLLETEIGLIGSRPLQFLLLTGLENSRRINLQKN